MIIANLCNRCSTLLHLYSDTVRFKVYVALGLLTLHKMVTISKALTRVNIDIISVLTDRMVLYAI